MNEPLNTLRNALQKHVEGTNDTFYNVAKKMDISVQALYKFRKGDGLHADSAIKLMKHLNLEIKDLK